VSGREEDIQWYFYYYGIIHETNNLSNLLVFVYYKKFGICSPNDYRATFSSLSQQHIRDGWFLFTCSGQNRERSTFVRLLLRIIVLANGSILETTVALSGTTISKSISPKTGEPITTIASTDKSFELHLKTNQISRVTFNKVQRGENGKVMRVCRLMDRDGSLSTSLILQAEMGEDHPRRWFDEMINQYGEEVVL